MRPRATRAVAGTPVHASSSANATEDGAGINALLRRCESAGTQYRFECDGAPAEVDDDAEGLSWPTYPASQQITWKGNCIHRAHIMVF